MGLLGSSELWRIAGQKKNRVGQIGYEEHGAEPCVTVFLPRGGPFTSEGNRRGDHKDKANVERDATTTMLHCRGRC